MLERSVAMSHGSTRYFTAGTSTTEPPLILLHGVGYSYGGNNWLRALEDLSKGGRQVLAPDILGWGQGGRLGQSYSFAYLVDFVREFQDVLKLGPCDVLGHSMGGWVATLLAYESPERVRRLILAGSGGVSARQLPEMTEFQSPNHDDLLRDVQARYPNESHETQQEIAKEEEANISGPDCLASYRRLLDHMMNPETRARYNTRRRLPFIKAETMLIWGENDNVNPPAMADVMKELLPITQSALMPCGHFPYSELPDEFNRLVNDFLVH